MKIIDESDFQKENEQKSSSSELKEEKKKSDIDYWPILEIPSMFKLYPKGTKLFGRKLDVLEIKKLAQRNEYNENFIVKDIFSTVFKGINPEDIYREDKLYLLLWLRANTFNEKGFSVDFKCTKCDELSTYDFSLDNLNVKFFNDKFFENNIVKMRNGDSIEVKYLTVKEEEKLEAAEEEFAKMKINKDLLETAASIKTINNENIPLINKYHYLINLKPSTDCMKLEAVINKYDFGVRPILNVKCNNCGGVGPCGVTFRKSFLTPEYRLSEDS